MFNVKTAVENQIQKPTRGAKEVERILPKYIRITLEKIDKSIEDAQGRYQAGRGHSTPTPSNNWKVIMAVPAPEGQVRPDLEALQEEEVLVWLKIGVRKVEIADGQTEIRIPASVLVDTLNEMRALVESIKDDPDSGLAKEFHAVAISQAKPKTGPKEEGKTWKYDAESDSYIAA